MSLVSKLNSIESRLEKLVEGSAGKLTSSPDFRHQLTHSLISAMGAAARQDGDLLLAPNFYTLVLPPGSETDFKTNQAILPELMVALVEAGEEAGFSFPTPPEVEVIEDPEIRPGQIQVIARIVEPASTDTKTLIPPEDLPSALSMNAFLIVAGHQIFPLDRMVVNIGRRPDNNLVIDDASVSRLHAQIRAIGGKFALFDLESTGGTYVNGQRVTSSVLYPGDVIALANVQLVFGQDAPRSLDESPGYTRPSFVDQRKTVTNTD